MLRRCDLLIVFGSAACSLKRARIRRYRGFGLRSVYKGGWDKKKWNNRNGIKGTIGRDCRMSLIECEKVALGYENTLVLDELDLEVNPGDYLCIVG